MKRDFLSSGLHFAAGSLGSRKGNWESRRKQGGESGVCSAGGPQMSVSRAQQSPPIDNVPPLAPQPLCHIIAFQLRGGATMILKERRARAKTLLLRACLKPYVMSVKCVVWFLYEMSWSHFCMQHMTCIWFVIAYECWNGTRLPINTELRKLLLSPQS